MNIILHHQGYKVALDVPDFEVFPTPPDSSSLIASPTPTPSPTHTPSPPTPVKIISLQRPLSDTYEDILYSESTNKLVTRRTNDFVLFFYNFDEGAASTSISNIGKHSSFLFLEETAVVEEMLPLMGRSNTCFEPTPGLTPEACPIIWQSEQYILNACAEIYEPQPNANPLFVRRIPLGSNIQHLIETNSNQLLILGETTYALYNQNSMIGHVYDVADGRWPTTQTSHLFLNVEETLFYIVHKPVGSQTGWVLVGALNE